MIGEFPAVRPPLNMREELKCDRNRPGGGFARRRVGCDRKHGPAGGAATVAPLRIVKGTPVAWEGASVEPFTFTPAEGLTAAALLKPAATGRVALYLDPRSIFESDARELVRLGYTLLALDEAGTGESAFSRHAGAPWSGLHVAFLALMTGRTMVGIRKQSGVTAFAKGRRGPVLLHAAVAAPRIARVVIEDRLVSYAAIPRSPCTATSKTP
jgi:hypothetical protein